MVNVKRKWCFCGRKWVVEPIEYKGKQYRVEIKKSIESYLFGDYICNVYGENETKISFFEYGSELCKDCQYDISDALYNITNKFLLANLPTVMRNIMRRYDIVKVNQTKFKTTKEMAKKVPITWDGKIES